MIDVYRGFLPMKAPNSIMAVIRPLLKDALDEVALFTSGNFSRN